MFLSRVFAGLILSTAAFPALAADYFDDFPELKGGYGEEWGLPHEPSPISTEIGLRYVYSPGSHSLSVGGDDYSANDTSHVLEMHLQVDDDSTHSYFRANAGLSALSDGTYSTPDSGGSTNMTGGSLGYGTADFGYRPWGNDVFRIGGFGGYQYLNNSLDMGRTNYVTSGGGGASEENVLEFHQLRLGASAHADLGSIIDVNIQGALIPFAAMNGTYGAFSVADFNDGGTDYVQGSAGAISGNLYGASAEAMLGVHPTDNFTMRIGGRVHYLTGDADVTFTAREDGAPTNTADYIVQTSALSFLRFGLLAEITGSF